MWLSATMGVFWKQITWQKLIIFLFNFHLKWNNYKNTILFTFLFVKQSVMHYPMCSWGTWISQKKIWLPLLTKFVSGGVRMFISDHVSMNAIYRGPKTMWKRDLLFHCGRWSWSDVGKCNISPERKARMRHWNRHVLWSVGNAGTGHLRVRRQSPG